MKASRAAAVEITRKTNGDWFAESSDDEAVAYRQAIADIIDRHLDPLPEQLRMAIAALEVSTDDRARLVRALELIAHTSCATGSHLRIALDGLAGRHRAAPTASLGEPEPVFRAKTPENACKASGEGADSHRSRDGTGQ